MAHLTPSYDLAARLWQNHMLRHTVTLWHFYRSRCIRFERQLGFHRAFGRVSVILDDWSAPLPAWANRRGPQPWAGDNWQAKHPKLLAICPVVQGISRLYNLQCGYEIPAVCPSGDSMSYSTFGPLGTRRSSVASFQEWKQQERNQQGGQRGQDLAEYATLALRIDPSRVEVDNECSPTCSVLRIDSANRPGTLIEVRCRVERFL